ncbi:MAG TPA: signal peptidase I [candidate division Zixibacteria bacterium]|nr:signal peptidase I [candidate division Zixibacteria bacterium]
MPVDKVSKEKEPIAAAERVEVKSKSTFREYAEAIGMALLLALFIRTFIVQAFKIPSGSMIPTLLIGDHILVNKLAYGVRVPFLEQYVLDFQKPRRGDVVVFIFPEDRSKDFIKRVIAVGGETVEIRAKKVYVNGVPIEDPHAHFEGSEFPGSAVANQDDYGPRTVPENHIFVMGDNRDRSHDSRFWGFVNTDDVKGKAFLIYWSWDGTDRWVRWERIGNVIY